MVVVQDTSAVSVAEASILADFFNLQADKHGPELLKKLSSLQQGAVSSVARPRQPAAEQRQQVKIEVEAENVLLEAADVCNVGEGRPRLGPVTHPRHSESAPAPTHCSLTQVRGNIES